MLLTLQEDDRQKHTHVLDFTFELCTFKYPS